MGVRDTKLTSSKVVEFIALVFFDKLQIYDKLAPLPLVFFVYSMSHEKTHKSLIDISDEGARRGT